MPGTDTERHVFRGRKWHTYRHSASGVLRGLQKGRSDGGRNVDRDEAISGEQVVLAALVDNAKVPIALDVLVRKDDVDLVALERCLVAVVLHADGEPAGGRDGLARSSRGTFCV